MFIKKYPCLTLLASVTLIIVSIWPLLHNIAYFNGGNLLGAAGILVGTLGVSLVASSEDDSQTGEK